jgi:uncharacterized membrane protein
VKEAGSPSTPTRDILRFVSWLHLIATLGLALWLIVVVLWFRVRETPLEPALSFCLKCYCHRQPERSLWLHGEPLPVCSRCTGVIVGYLLGGVFAVCGAERFRWWNLITAIVLIGLMGVSWLGGYYGVLHERWQWERVFAGLLGGLGGYIFIACCVVWLCGVWQQIRGQ